MARRLRLAFLLAAWAGVGCVTPRGGAQLAPPERPVAPGQAAADVRVAAADPAPDGRVHFVVLHSNDVHGQVLPRQATWLGGEQPPLVGGLGRLAARVVREQREAEALGAHVLVVDGGDCYQGTPEGVIDGGLPFLTAKTAVGYDAVCIGNHEFDFGIPNLVSLLAGSRLPAVAANLRERPSGERVAWTPPWRIVERGGVRIALVGLVTPETPDITHPDARALDFEDPAEALTRARRELGAAADWILPVTHLGVAADRALARAHPDLPLVVGGHSHTFLKEGVREGHTLIVQAGAKASVLGRVDLVWDRAARQVVESRARLLDLDQEPEAADRVARVDEICADLARRSAVRMGEVVGQLAAPLSRFADPASGRRDPLASSAAGNLIADVLRAHALADVGVMNRGGIRTDLAAGPVTRRDVFEICPFENNVTVVVLTGAELFELFRRSVEGSAHSGLEVSGAVVEAARDAQGRRVLLGLTVGGAPLERSREYRVALNSFLADGGDAYLERVPPGPRRQDDALLVRDALEQWFRHRSPIVPDPSNRYLVRSAP
ncbi:MAG: bifunctional metallophosphatase/5'-nucleotidase [Planctomycetes bacterium]|nr:bifunctional metallophosphatase/5'-nucleotidase [Planctomycetota bacterium]